MILVIYIIHTSFFFSVGIIILGAVIAGIRDLSFDGYGYGLVFTANICTATYLALIARIGNISHILLYSSSSIL